MKLQLNAKAALQALALSLVMIPAGIPAAETVRDSIAMVRTVYQSDRKLAVAEVLELGADESMAFWPIYHAYRADIEKIGDSLVKLVLEYSDNYPNVPEDRARQMLKEYSALEEKLADVRASHFKKARKAISANKVLRWAQFENRMDALLRLQLASVIPLVPSGSSKP